MQIGNSFGGSNYFQNRNQIKLKQTVNQQNTAKTTSSNNTVDENKLDGDFEKLNTVDSKLSSRQRAGLRAFLNLATGWFAPFGFPSLGDVLLPENTSPSMFNADGSYNRGAQYGRTERPEDAPDYKYTQEYNDKPKKDFLA